MNIFDPKICRQHLQECLKKVLSCYDAFKEEEINNANREIIESIYLMFNLGDIDAIKRAFSLPNAIRYYLESITFSMYIIKRFSAFFFTEKVIYMNNR